MLPDTVASAVVVMGLGIRLGVGVDDGHGLGNTLGCTLGRLASFCNAKAVSENPFFIKCS